MNDFVNRLGKCYTGVVHDIMRDLGYENSLIVFVWFIEYAGCSANKNIWISFMKTHTCTRIIYFKLTVKNTLGDA